MQSTIRQLVTHARPHIDDLLALWLFKRFYPPYRKAQVHFLDRPKDGQFSIPDDALAVGIGFGQFDEHRPDGVDECAATLVWKWLVIQPECTVMPIQKSALSRIVEWVRKEDHGELKNMPWFEWSVTIPAEQFWLVVDGDHDRVYAFGANIFDALLVYFEGIAALEDDWKKRLAFVSRWGKAVAIESSAGGVSQRAYTEGALLVVQIDPATGSRSFRTHGQSTEVDLTDIYMRVHALEPDASWFLHPNKRLLLCGSRTAPDFTPSQLSLEEMITLAKQPA